MCEILGAECSGSIEDSSGGVVSARGGKRALCKADRTSIKYRASRRVKQSLVLLRKFKNPN
jgi:hypothetical protein